MKSLIFIITLLTTIITFGAELNYTTRIAKLEDVEQLLQLINKEAIRDHDKIVILPRLFRKEALEAAIKKGRMFVALHEDTIVGYKKLFLTTDTEELDNMLTEEIRCLDENKREHEENRVLNVLIDEQGKISSTQKNHLCGDIALYNGADFTAKDFRGKGINTTLTNFALSYYLPIVQELMKKDPKKAITLLYGITLDNAGLGKPECKDRTPGISKSFIAFLKHLVNDDAIKLHHSRYSAYMPSFDPESAVCCPLPDDQSIPGFGCLLTYTI